MTNLSPAAFTRNPDALAGPGSSKGGPPGNGITLPRSVAGWTNSIVPGAFHDTSSPSAHLGAASAWNAVRATAGVRKNLANIIPTGAVNKRTPNGISTDYVLPGSTGPAGSDPWFQGAWGGLLPPGSFGNTPPGAQSGNWLIGKKPIIVGGPFDNTGLGPWKGGKLTPVNPGGGGGGGGGTTGGGTPSAPTPGPTGTPIDPALQALASIFGAGASGAQPGAMLSTQPVNPSSGGGTSGIVILGALAGIGGLIYLWWSHHKKAA